MYVGHHYAQTHTHTIKVDISGKLIYHKIGMHSRSGSLETGKQRHIHQ
jgi:hypothetical protein